MRILITGGGGFIGSHLCKTLLQQGNTVVCVDNFITGTKAHLEALLRDDRFQLIEQDITKPFEVDGEIDRVYHLASPASPNHHSPISYHALAMETMMVNTNGTHRMLELAEQKHARFLFASTSEIYGDPLVNPQPETYLGNVSTTGPRSVYDEAKRFGETLVAYFVRSRHLDARIARIFNTYGPNMHKDDLRMVASFALSALQNKPVQVFGDGKQTRSLCYVTDTVRGLIALMEHEGITGEICNIGSEEEHTVNEYAEMIIQVTNSSSSIVHDEKLPVDDPKVRRADITKAKRLLNWSPTVTLEEGLRETIEFVKSQLSTV